MSSGKVSGATYQFLLFYLAPALLIYAAYPWDTRLYLIPALALFGITALLYNRTLFIPYRLMAIVGLLLLTQLALYLSGALHFVTMWTLFLCWVATGSLLFFLGASMTEAEGSWILHAYIPFALLWGLLATALWLGWTGGDSIHTGPIAFTTLPQSKLNSSFLNGNVFSILLGCAWVIAFWQWLRSTQTKWTWYLLMVITWVWSLAATSKGTWVAEACIVAVVMWQLYKTKRRGIVLPFMVAGALAMAGAYALAQNGTRSAPPPTQTVEAVSTGSSAARITIAKSVIEVWKESPLTGVGLGNLSSHYLDGQARALGDSDHGTGLLYVTAAHNHLIHLLAEGGLPGLIVWIAVLILLARSLLTLQTKPHSFRWAALLCALLLWIQGLFNISLNQAFPFLFFCLLLGMASQPQLQQWKGFHVAGSYTAIAALLLATALSVGTYHSAVSWLKFDTFVSLSLFNPETRTLANDLVQDESIAPHIISSLFITQIKHPEGLEHYLPALQQAYKTKQLPRLIQEIFFVYGTLGDWEKACETGNYITRQRWEHITDQTIFHNACKRAAQNSREKWFPCEYAVHERGVVELLYIPGVPPSFPANEARSACAAAIASGGDGASVYSFK